MSVYSIFKIRKEERWLAVIGLCILCFFQYLIISKFLFLFVNYNDENWTIFMKNFHMSGFDPITYSVITDWNIGYNEIRHPLLPFLMYPLYLLNKVLWWVTGVNCVQFVVGIALMFCAFYSFILIFRILYNQIGVMRGDAFLLTILFFGFAYVLITVIVPDHFCFSLFLILFTLYRAGEKIQKKQLFSLQETLILFILTSGVTLSNGVIIGLAVLFVNGHHVFNRKFLVGVGVASLLLVGIGVGVNAVLDNPSDQNVHEWIDTSVPRWATFVENFFGESIQLHRKYILGDALTVRPVIVPYSWTVQYAVEGLIVVLFLTGIYFGRRSRLLQLTSACFLYTIMLHIVLGFAINEVYIMSAHWIYIIPISIAFLFTSVSRRPRIFLRMVILSIVIYLWTYHGILLYNYLTWPLKIQF